jgi:hypothetical protein
VLVQVGSAYTRRIILPDKRRVHQLRDELGRRAGRLVFPFYRLLRLCLRLFGHHSAGVAAAPDRTGPRLSDLARRLTATAALIRPRSSSRASRLSQLDEQHAAGIPVLVPSEDLGMLGDQRLQQRLSLIRLLAHRDQALTLPQVDAAHAGATLTAIKQL